MFNEILFSLTYHGWFWEKKEIILYVEMKHLQMYPQKKSSLPWLLYELQSIDLILRI